MNFDYGLYQYQSLQHMVQNLSFFLIIGVITIWLAGIRPVFFMYAQHWVLQVWVGWLFVLQTRWSYACPETSLRSFDRVPALSTLDLGCIWTEAFEYVFIIFLCALT